MYVHAILIKLIELNNFICVAEEFMLKSFESEKSVGILTLFGNLHQPLRNLFKLLDFPCFWCCIYNCTYSKRAL